MARILGVFLPMSAKLVNIRNQRSRKDNFSYIYIMKDLEKLEVRIRGLFKKIQDKKTTPAESGIGVLFTHLKKMDEPSYEKHLAEYKLILAAIK